MAYEGNMPIESDVDFAALQARQQGLTATQRKGLALSGTGFVSTLNGKSGALVLGGGTSGFTFSTGTGTVTMASPLTTKGDLYARSASAGTRLGVGSDGQVLTADALEATGMKWTTPGAGGVGTVTSVSVVSANGVSGSVATSTTTPAITLSLGAITPSSVAAVGTVTGSNLSGTNTGDQTITLTGDVTGSGTSSFAATIAAGAVTLAKMADMATASLIYRKTAGSGAPEVNTLATLKTDLLLTGTNSGDQTITLTGDVTGSGTGSFAATIGANKVTLAMMATMATASLLGRNTAAVGNVEVLSAATAKTLLSLDNVTNTSDANKPVSTAQQAALDLKANLASPTLTGTPAAPTAAVDTATTQIATTAYVVNQAYAKLASPTFSGTPSLPTGTTGITQSAGDSSTKLATTAFVTTADNLKANLASPTFTGTVTIPTGAQITKPNIIGTATNDNASAGSEGELLSATVVQASAVALTTATPANITSISLTAGDWDVSGVAVFLSGATTSLNLISASISQTSATMDFTAGSFSNTNYPAGGTVLGVTNNTLVNNTVRISLSGTTTIYFVASCTFTVSTLKAWGIIRARRVR